MPMTYRPGCRAVDCRDGGCVHPVEVADGSVESRRHPCDQCVSPIPGSREGREIASGHECSSRAGYYDGSNLLIKVASRRDLK